MRRFISSHQSVLVASTIAAVLGLWLLSGSGAPGSASPESAEAPARTAATPFTVRTTVMDAAAVGGDVVIYGRTEPARAVTLRAEIDGRVVEVAARRGTRVAKGDLIARLDMRDLAAQLTEARAEVHQRELEHEASTRLERKRFQTETAVAQASANLASARARAQRVQIAIANTTLRAPFGGILETRPVEIGDFVSEGNEVARLIEVNPLLVVGTVTQRELTHVHPGASGVAQLMTGEQIAGRVRYVSSESDQATRTFRVELEVPNPDMRWVAGVTAEIRIPTPPTQAHLVSPALLSIDAQRRIGIKTVSEDNRVAFRPVSILRSDEGGVWVTGLPGRARVITVGQGFVRDGDEVNAVEGEAGADTASGAAQLRRTQG